MRYFFEPEKAVNINILIAFWSNIHFGAPVHGSGRRIGWENCKKPMDFTHFSSGAVRLPSRLVGGFRQRHLEPRRCAPAVAGMKGVAPAHVETTRTQ